MTIKIHGNYSGGEFLTGDLDFVTIYTTHAVEQNGVTQNLADFKAERFIPTATNISTLSAAERTVQGVVIADDAAWTQANARQVNLNKIMGSIGTIAAPVIATAPVEVAIDTTAAITGTFAGTLVEAGNLGAAVATPVFAMTFAIEHTHAFSGVQGTKTVSAAGNSIALDGALAGIAILQDDTGAAVAVEVVVPGTPSATSTIATHLSNTALVAG